MIRVYFSRTEIWLCCRSVVTFFLCEQQENCNLLVSTEYNEKTRRAMALMSEKEHSFELIEVRLDWIYTCSDKFYCYGV